MPPDPILGLLCFVGLLLYGAIGGVLGTVAVRFLGDSERDLKSRNSYTRGIAGKGGDEDGWIGFGFVAALWPAALGLALGLAIIVGVLFVVFALPVIITRQIGIYSANVLR